MSTINTAPGSGATLAPALHLGQNRNGRSWGALLAGAVVAVATTLLLSLLGAVMGAGSIRANSCDEKLVESWTPRFRR
jgi:hypothetical protein